MIRRLLLPSVAVGFALLTSGVAHAKANLNVEVSTTVGGADAGEYLLRVHNPGAGAESGVLELRHPYTERAVAQAPFEVPAKSTRYYRIPAEASARLGAVAITPGGAVTAQQRRTSEGTTIVFDIPPRDDQRLQELRVHKASGTAVLAHATFDESTGRPILTQRATTYDGVALVVARSSVFLRLPAAEREALVAWVRTGGALALSITDDRDLVSLSGLVGEGVTGTLSPGKFMAWSGGRVSSTGFGAGAPLGLGRVELLPVDLWSAESNGDAGIQDKLMDLAKPPSDRRRGSSRYYASNQGAMETARVLDPNQNYRSVMVLAGVLLAAQALVMALGFRRLSRRRGMSAAYRFAVGTSAVSFGAVIGLGIYAKGGFGARARELAFIDAASGEGVVRVERTRMYFSSQERTVEVSPRDPANLVTAHDTLEMRGADPRAVIRVNDAGNVVLGDVRVRPWRATLVSETGLTKLGGGVRVERKDGQVVVRNASGATLRNVLVSTPLGGCLAFGDIENGREQASSHPRACTGLGPQWRAFDTVHQDRLAEGLLGSPRDQSQLILLGEIEEDTGTTDGFRLEKRTTLLRVTGDAS